MNPVIKAAGDRRRPVEQHHPMVTLAMPRLIELCFQTAGIWEMQKHSRMGLPLHVDRITLSFKPGRISTRLYAVVTPGADGQSYNAQVVDEPGNAYLELIGYRTVAFAEAVDVEPLRHAMHATAGV